jgi:hypothetical protein
MNGSAILQNFISVMDSFLVLYLGRTPADEPRGCGDA